MLSSVYNRIVSTCVFSSPVSASLSVMAKKYNRGISEFCNKPVVGEKNPSFSQWFTGAGKPEIMAVAEFDGRFDSKVFHYSSKHPHADTMPAVLSKNPNGRGYLVTSLGATRELSPQKVLYSSKFFAVTVSDMSKPSADGSFSFVLRFFTVNIGHDSPRSKAVLGESNWFALADLKSALSRGVPTVQGMTFPVDKFIREYDSQDASLRGFVSWLKSGGVFNVYGITMKTGSNSNANTVHRVAPRQMMVNSADSKSCVLYNANSATFASSLKTILSFEDYTPIMFAGDFLVLMFNDIHYIVLHRNNSPV